VNEENFGSKPVYQVVKAPHTFFRRHFMQKLFTGIDVSKNDLDVAYYHNGQSFFLGKYPNNQTGFDTIAKELESKKQKTNSDIIFIVMEPTGGYEQHFAFQNQWEVSLPNPGQFRDWVKGTGKRARTDKQDAMMLAKYGSVVDPPTWKPLPPELAQLESMLNRLDGLKEILRSESNRLEAYQNRVKSDDIVIDSIRQSISSLESQIDTLEKAIKEHFDKYPELKEQNTRLKTVPGVGEKISPHLLVSMYRFSQLTRANGTSRGVTAYFGLDPKPHESGISVYKRSSISRQGNRSIRHYLFMGALGGVRGNNPLRVFYQRLLSRNKAKMVALVASARKIIVWCWAVFNSGKVFDPTRFETA
jgi:transposase